MPLLMWYSSTNGHYSAIMFAFLKQSWLCFTFPSTLLFFTRLNWSWCLFGWWLIQLLTIYLTSYFGLMYHYYIFMTLYGLSLNKIYVALGSSIHRERSQDTAWMFSYVFRQGLQMAGGGGRPAHSALTVSCLETAKHKCSQDNYRCKLLRRWLWPQTTTTKIK